MSIKIAIASDHGGYELKEFLKSYLDENSLIFEDLGTYSPESCDYIDYAEKCAEKVISGAYDLGILVCGTGIGISIAANKVKGIRCALCYSPETARLAKEHNNANIIALGGRTTDKETATAIVEAFLSAEFQGGRHQTRIDKISLLEEK